MKFVIDRKTWRRGGWGLVSTFGETRLLNKEGYMCCLGQIALQCGVPKEDIFLRTYPVSVHPKHINYRMLLTNAYKTPNELASNAMKINDDEHISDSEREQILTKLFAEHGHELEFVS